MYLVSVRNATLAKLTIDHVVSATDSGGIVADTSNITITDSVFRGCEGASNAYGGCLWVSNGDASLSYVDFLDSKAGAGGCLFLFRAKLLGDHLTFRGCSADFGGGLYSFNSAVVISTSVFSNNSVDSIGGAARMEYGGIIFDECLFEENVAGKLGGAVYGVEAVILAEHSTFRVRCLL
jgi:predicted outer membrane repeat protein